MTVEQLSIFVENKPGRLAAVTKTLADNGVSIRALSVADSTDFGILRLIVDNVEKAVEALQKKGVSVAITEVVAVEVEDRTGGLATVLSHFDEAKVNVEYMYAFARKSGGNAIIIFRFEHMPEAIEALEQTGVIIKSPEEIYQL